MSINPPKPRTRLEGVQDSIAGLERGMRPLLTLGIFILGLLFGVVITLVAR